MSRFVSRQYYVEAQQFQGTVHLWPDEFRLAVVRHLPDGTIMVATGDGPRSCRTGDFVINGPAGFEVIRRVPFETMFTSHVEPEVLAPDSETPKRAKR